MSGEPKARECFAKKGGTVADLHLAIRAQDLAAVRNLVLEGNDCLNTTLRGVTALSLAIHSNDIEIVKQLIKSGACVNSMSKDHNDRFETPLVTACRLGKKDVVQVLIAANADVNKADYFHQTPLWMATKERRLDLVNILLQNGADVNMIRNWEECPLFLATKYLNYGCRRDIALRLIQCGINLNMSDHNKYTPLYWALKFRDEEMSKCLIEYGASIHPMKWATVEKQIGSILRQNSEFYEYVKTELINPCPLRRQCLVFIRKILATNSKSAGELLTKFERLPAPKILIDIMTLKYLNNEYSQDTATF